MKRFGKLFFAYLLFLGVGVTNLAVFSSKSFAEPKAKEYRLAVALKVDPIAHIEFPKGTSFKIRIPSLYEWLNHRDRGVTERLPYLGEVHIPFIVTGNAWVAVSVELGEVRGAPLNALEIRPLPNASSVEAQLEMARRHQKHGINALNLWVEFPKHLTSNTTSKLSFHSGGNPTPNTMSRVNVADGPVFGVIHVIPNIIWGESARRNVALPGFYRGNVQVTISASDE